MGKGKKYSDEQEGFEDKIGDPSWDSGSLALDVGNSLREEMGPWVGNPVRGLGIQGVPLLKWMENRRLDGAI